ncbi:Omp28-related outer membrane protein [bacterium]|nr:Omp28-related outer membrane protein [Bacteroides sp.]MBD5385236.1 Omp28-related outer membrane protein [bacterium]
MRRTLLTLLGLASLAGAAALTPSGRHHATHPGDLTNRFPTLNMGAPNAPRAHAARNLMRVSESNETLSMNWGYCEGLYMAIPMAEGLLKGAIVMTEELTEKYAGAELSSISVANPIDITTQTPNYETMVYEYVNPVSDVTVWLSEGLDKEPFLSVDGKLTKQGFKWSTIDLPTPYTVEAGKQLVIGYTIEVPANSDFHIYPLITDYSYDTSEYSCQVYTNMTGYDNAGWPLFSGDYSWQDLGSDFGNICIRAMLSGDMLPVDNVETIAYQVSPFVSPGGDLMFQSIIRNLGANTVSSVEYTMEVEGMEPQTCTVAIDPAIPYFEYSDVLTGTFTSTTVGNNIPYSCRLSAINGKKLETPGDAMTGTFLCIDEGYPKNNLFEEATGTWCGWCVVGYAGMEYMAKNYSDKGFIGIAVHGGDEMDVMDAGQAYEEFGYVVEGFPSAYLNRNMASSIYPAPEDLEEEMYWISGIPAYADVAAKLENTDDEKVIRLSVETEFGDSEDNASYMIGYTVMEDGVGPYLQSNYTSGTGEDYYGFEDMPQYVPLWYNEVARNCSRPMGVAESLPAVIKKGEKYNYTTDITLDDVKDPGKVRVVAMVINGINGMVENSVCVNVPGYTGIKAVSDQATTGAFVYGTKGALRFRVNPSEANVYTIDGRRIANGIKGNSLELPAGIYIVELNGKTCKVLVR